jgi:A/G-specific adenine glycosylase
VWLSEIMLQQTTVAAVAPRYASFLNRWPTLHALAQAPEQEVMAEWAGLGYYRRASALIACARQLASSGGFPVDEDALRQLPGVGSYTAAAIAAIAFGQRAVVIDANVERIVARLGAMDEPLAKARRAIHVAVDRLTPERRAGDFAQAMMDLGATICTPRAPRCPVCPLRQGCVAAAGGAPERYPVKAPRSERPLRKGRAYFIDRGDAVWLVRRVAGGMLGGMRALPDDGWGARQDGHGRAPVVGSWRQAGRVDHAFTHFRLELEVLSCRADHGGTGAGEWWPLDRLSAAGLPTVFARAARLVVTSIEEPVA